MFGKWRQNVRNGREEKFGVRRAKVQRKSSAAQNTAQNKKNIFALHSLRSKEAIEKFKFSLQVPL